MSTSHWAIALVSSLALSGLLGCGLWGDNDSNDLIVVAQAAPSAPREQQLSLPLTPRALLPELPSSVQPALDSAPIGVLEGVRSDTCIHGWSSPGRGSALRKAALDMIRERPSERFVVVDIRYFLGPEDAEVMGPPREVERWYVKAYSTTRRSRQQRWLVRRARVGSGVDAVAPFDSTGYGPGTWRRPDAVDESVTDPFQRPCDRGAQKCMGLPRQVLGCLRGT